MVDESPDDNETWDVVVVGGGPAGTSSARAAAAAGARVLLLERARMPRYKTCGGGIVGASLAALPDGFPLPVKDQVHTVEFTYRGRLRRVRRSPTPLFSLVDRTELDTALAAAARRAGVTVREGVTATRVVPEGDAVRIELAGAPPVYGRAVVGADGSASRVAGQVGVRLDTVDLGLEAEIPVPEDVAGRWRSRVLLDWGPLPGSYGWVFPKGDRLTVGVIAARGSGERTRAYLADFVARLGLSGYPPQVSSGHLTRCRRPDSPVCRGRVFVAGDAAGLLDPWTREGISFALRSGAHAGRCAAMAARGEVDAAGYAYRGAVDEVLGGEMAAGRSLLAGFTRRPLVFHAAVGLVPPAWRAFREVVAGQATFPSILRQPAARRALRMVSGRPSA